MSCKPSRELLVVFDLDQVHGVLLVHLGQGKDVRLGCHVAAKSCQIGNLSSAMRIYLKGTVTGRGKRM